MNITKDIIADLYPLYAENECSADTRALVADYLARHPQEAETLRRAATTSLPVLAPSPAQLAETQSLREARRRVRRRAWWMGLALFFSLAPFSFHVGGGTSWWMLRDAPGSAAIYATLGLALWIAWFWERHRSKCL